MAWSDAARAAAAEARRSRRGVSSKSIQQKWMLRHMNRIAEKRLRSRSYQEYDSTGRGKRPEWED